MFKGLINVAFPYLFCATVVLCAHSAPSVSLQIKFPTRGGSRISRFPLRAGTVHARKRNMLAHVWPESAARISRLSGRMNPYS